MFVLIVPIAMVAIGIIITVAGMSRQAKEAQKKAEAEKAMKLLDEKDDFKKFLNYDSSSNQSRPQPQRPQQTQSTTYRPQPARPTAQTSKQQMTAELQQRLVELKRAQAEKNAGKANQVVESSHHDSHCDTSHAGSGDRYRVEYVPTMNSIGGKSTEGCQDHYNVRYVKLDDVDEEEVELTALQKAIVYGEVINQPAFKRKTKSRQ